MLLFLDCLITQRGNRRQQTFFEEQDYHVYLDLMAEWCARFGVEIWGYCLMPNHVHLIAVPKVAEGLRLAIGEAHRRFTRYINFRMKWRGHLWQERFASFPMDEAHLYLLDHCPRLTRYLDDGRLEMDNNAVENAIRPFVIGRKGWACCGKLPAMSVVKGTDHV